MEFNQILFRISCISAVHFYQIPFLFLPLLVVMAASSEGRSLEKRQTQSGDRFFLFGQVMRSLGQSEVTSPNQSSTIKYHHLLLKLLFRILF